MVSLVRISGYLSNPYYRKSSENDKNIFFNKAKSRPRRSTGAGGSSSTGEKNLRKAYV